MKFSKRAVLAFGLAVGLSGAALAGPPATGLGQAWPNVADQSLATGFHAYVFVIGGIQYIQINDANGNVLGGVGNASGQYIVLPVGLYSQQVSTPQQTATTTATPTAAPTTVYNDGTTAITETPMSDGTTALVATAECDPVDCASRSP
jgi:hypothetical protein